MELARKERLMLANQFKILDKLYPGEGYDSRAEIVERGYEAEYENIFEGVSENMISEEESQQVADIMEMYQALRIGYDQLEDKSGISESSIDFQGFDQNHEQNAVAYANFLRKQGGYTDIGHGKVNQGVRTMARYERMLEVWKGLPEEQRFPLSKENIQRVLAAQSHPDNRKQS